MKIFVAMHKIVNLIVKNDLYVPLLVGSFDKESDKVLRDDRGENISGKNENYCELTGVYWIWKNSEEDIVGLCHYRRFLSKKHLSIRPKDYLNKCDIEKILNKKKYDIILPEKHYFSDKVISEKSTAPNEEDMQIIRDIITEKYPDYIRAYDFCVNGHSLYLCNVMITKKMIFDKYCEWLFDILFEAEKRIDVKTYMDIPYRKRLFGFISERLLNVWIAHNCAQFKIVEYPLVNIESDFTHRLKNLILQKIRKIKFGAIGK